MMKPVVFMGQSKKAIRKMPEDVRREFGRVYVLDAFKKKSKSGKATPKADLDRIAERLKAAKALHKSDPP